MTKPICLNIYGYNGMMFYYRKISQRRKKNSKILGPCMTGHKGTLSRQLAAHYRMLGQDPMMLMPRLKPGLKQVNICHI